MHEQAVPLPPPTPRTRRATRRAVDASNRGGRDGTLPAPRQARQPDPPVFAPEVNILPNLALDENQPVSLHFISLFVIYI